MRLDDPAVDSIPSQTRDGLLLEALRGQIAFMRAKVPYWHERLATAAVDESRIETMPDLARLPIFSKQDPCDCGLTAPRLRDVHRLATTD